MAHDGSTGLPASLAPLPGKLLVTTKEGARITSTSDRTFWGLGQRNEIPRVMVGRSVRYAVTDILAWIDRQRAAAKSA